MKRTAFAPRKKPMARGSWSRKSSPLPEGGIKTAMRRTGMKSRINKPTVAEGSKYLEACRGERCYLDVFGVCLHDPATVVACHSNQSKHGKGMGIKAEHRYSVPGCRACHVFIDQGTATREYKFSIWDRAYAEWAPIRAQKMGIQTEELEVA